MRQVDREGKTTIFGQCILTKYEIITKVHDGCAFIDIFNQDYIEAMIRLVQKISEDGILFQKSWVSTIVAACLWYVISISCDLIPVMRSLVLEKIAKSCDRQPSTVRNMAKQLRSTGRYRLFETILKTPILDLNGA